MGFNFVVVKPYLGDFLKAKYEVGQLNSVVIGIMEARPHACANPILEVICSEAGKDEGSLVAVKDGSGKTF